MPHRDVVFLKFDLEDRTTEFARKVIQLCKELPRDLINQRLIPQIVGSSGSIGANYREANDSLGKKDFILRLKISRKEAKETCHWLILLKEANSTHSEEIDYLSQEVDELRNILSAIIQKSQ